MMEMSKKIPHSDKYLTEEEIKKLIQSIEILEDKTLILFTLETGLRRSEVVNIYTSNLEFKRQVVQVFDDKKDEWRSIVYPNYVGSQVKMYLNNREESSQFLFPFCGKTANRKLKKWAKKADIRTNDMGQTDVSFHWLRHTYIRRSKKVGRDIKVVQQNTGDTIETVLKYYRDLSIEDRIFEIESKPLLKEGVDIKTSGQK